MFVTGRLALLALLYLPIVGAVPGWTSILIGLALLGVLIGVDVALAASVRTLRGERSGRSSLRLGESGLVTLRLVNDGSRTLRGVVRDAWLPSAQATPARTPVTIPGGDAAVIDTRLTPSRRGDHHPDRVTVRSRGPFGIAGRQGAVRAGWSVRVLPAFASRRHLPSRITRLQELEGRTPVMIRGAGTEFDTLRPYVDGDDVRSIDWRATARATDVMVRTWRPERDRRVVIALDTGRTAAARIGDAPRLDSAMDAALLLAALAGRAGDHASLMVHDAQLRTWISGAEGVDALPSMVQALALVEPVLTETDARAMVSQILSRQRQRALVVILTALEPAALREGLLPVLPLLTAKHQVVIASVSDPRMQELIDTRGDVDAVYAAASAERAERERRDVAALLSLKAVDLVEADPEHIAPALADHYIALKATGRL
jgi:uncharacterized protein (DUF58 family)